MWIEDHLNAKQLRAERDELLIQKQVLLDAIDSWKAMNTKGRQERDDAMEAAKEFWPLVLCEEVHHTPRQYHECSPCPVIAGYIQRWPWLEETDPTDDSDLLHYHNKPVGWGDGEPDDWEAKVEEGIPLTREELDDLEDRGR